MSRLKNLLIVSGAVAAACVAWLALQSLAGANATTVVLPKAPIAVDLGEQYEQQGLPCQLELNNSGGIPITIARFDVTPQCGCIRGLSAPQTISAHGKLVLPLQLDLKGPAGNWGEEWVSREYTIVATVDGQPRPVVWKLLAKVKRLVTMESTESCEDIVARPEGQNRRTVRIRFAMKVKSLQAVSDAKGLTVECLPDPMTANCFTATIRILPREPGHFRHEVRFFAHDEQGLLLKTLPLSVAGEWQEDVYCLPSTVVLGKVVGGIEQIQAVSLYSRVGKPFTIRSCTSEDPGVHVQARGDQRSVSASCTPPNRPGPYRAAVCVHVVDHTNREYTIRIPVAAYVAD
jgi:hypothetical protein